MIVARFFRADLITEVVDQPAGYAVVLRGDDAFMHGQATQLAKHHGADAYQLCEGHHLMGLEPVSLTHDIRGLK